MSWNNPGKFTLQGIRKGIGYNPSYFGIQTHFGNKSRNISHNGSISFDSGEFTVRLHHTDIVTRRSDGSYLVNNGGWASPTTKKWINLFTGLGIYQKDFQWFVGDMPICQYALKTPNGLIFTDSLKLSQAGTPAEQFSVKSAMLVKMWNELGENPDSHEWTIDQWEEFLTSKGLIKTPITFDAPIKPEPGKRVFYKNAESKKAYIDKLKSIQGIPFMGDEYSLGIIAHIHSDYVEVKDGIWSTSLPMKWLEDWFRIG